MCNRESGTRAPFYVRILIDRKERNRLLLAKSFWSFSAHTSFVVSDIKNRERRQVLDAKNISVGVARDGRLMINGRCLLSDRVKIESTQGSIKWDKYTYNGSFFVMRYGDTFLLINNIELEKYVESGLRWEMFPGWPAATLEAGAIAYRTYAVNAVQQKRRVRKTGADDPDGAYDIGSTWVHQVYRGTHECQSIYDAVKKTRGLVVAFDGKPIAAMYHACCGGSVPVKRERIDFDKYPYLARAYPCVHCKKCSCFSWKYSCSLAALSGRLSSVADKDASAKTSARKARKAFITDMAIDKKDAAGTVLTLRLTVDRRPIIIPTGTLTQLIPEIKSGTFVLKNKGKSVFF